MVRLKYSDLLDGYDINTGTITIDLLDLKDLFITRLAIPPAWFFNKTRPNKRSKNKFNDKFKIVKFRLNRLNEFPEIGSIRIAHDIFLPSTAAIFIQGLQIKDLTNNKLTNIPINRPIKALGPDAKFTEQMYEANKSIKIEPDEDMFNDSISPNVTLTELLMFLFIYVNISLMSMLSVHYFLPNQNDLVLQIITCFVPNFASLVFLVLIIKLYQHYVKERFILQIGSNNWRLVRVLFIIISLNCSIVMDCISFWLISIGIARNHFDITFLIVTSVTTIASILITIAIHSSNHFKINNKFKEGSLTLLIGNQITKEKTVLNVPLDLFLLKKSKERIQG